MVLPSGETSVSSLSKVNLSSTSSEFDSVTHTGYAGMGNEGFANSGSVFKQTDVGSTDPRLVRNVATRSKDEFQCNETLNNLSAEQLVSRSRDADVEYANEFRGNGQEHKNYSLAGRFARACLLHDTSPSPHAGCDLLQGGYEMTKKTSRDKTRCWSNYSDGQESCLSAQSGLETPNDGSRSGSTTDCNDIFLDVSDMSLSVEEPPAPLPSELDSEAPHPPITFRDLAMQNLQKNDNLCCDAVNVKEATTRDLCLVRKTPEDAGGDFDIYNIETTLPYMNWDYLEEQLQRAIKKEEMSQSQRNDREKIRQKLAMGLDEEHFSAGDRLFKKPSLQSRLHSAMNLQMCFVNEASSDVAENASDTEQVERKNCKGLCPRELSSSLLFHSLSSSSSLASSKSSLQSAAMATATIATAAPPAVSSASQEDLDFFTRQARLQAEARLALAQVRPMAHMQLQLEKQTRRKSPIADIVGIPGFGDGKHSHLSRQLLQHMNFGQLQVVVNDMHTQIEAFNSELMELLIDRDDLHMAQDSMLVDIEDLTRRAQEYEMRIKSKLIGSQNSC